jgi:hypothetical protein
MITVTVHGEARKGYDWEKATKGTDGKYTHSRT